MPTHRVGPIFTIVAIACLLALLVADKVYAVEYKITGVNDSKIESNIRLHLQTLDIDTSVQPERLWQDPIIKKVNLAIQPFGYYSAEMAVIDDEDHVTINVFLGDPLTITAVIMAVVGEGKQDDWFTERFNAFPLREGDVLLQHQYDAFKSDMIATAVSRGYFDFSWETARLDLIRSSKEAFVMLVADSGPRYRIGELRINGDDIALEIINRINPLTPGKYYLAQDIGEFNRVLNATGYFNRAIARPLVSEARDNVVPIEVTVVHKPRDLFDIGGGFSTDIGPQFSAKWVRPWVNSRGHRFSSEIFVSEPEQNFTSSYRIPMADVNHDYINILMGYERVDDNNTRSDNTSFGIQRFWKPADSRWQQSISLRYQNETFTQAGEITQTTDLVLPGYSISGFRSRGGIDISWGDRSLLSIEGGSEDLLSDIDIFRLSAKTKWIRTFDEHRITVRGELGALASSDFEQVPSSLRFFAGGDQSIRGFGYEKISPVDEENELTGARYVAVGSIEYAYPVYDNWRIATFLDAGTATNDFDEDLVWSTGIGVHYLSIIGPVRLYLARGDNNGDTSFRIHFSIGPEL
ncbi:autotransporter assembly complex family protein [Alteromonas sp. ASW11-36]|uniref:Translocation and assembly module subunit TamA n=1 Tax=Alteromonas arenosi TaxID=3055817 RepID=A0ABT7T1A7_9ALTE|nr:autotransporter assembly complex family protein [Alteromonas sp. ASW11-36]MDM7862236.1 autotransporter assembly complex family protein [Alteromonas sp. ASW11-36]